MKKKNPLKTYKMVIYDTFNAAKQDREVIQKLCSGADQVNVVVRAEGNMDDPEILDIDQKVKLYAGAAWSLIHERRLTDGWYDSPQE